MRPLNPNLDKCVQRVCHLDAKTPPKASSIHITGKRRGKFLMQCCSHTWCCQRTGGKKGKELGGHLWGASILARATEPLLTSLRACPPLPTHLNPIIPSSPSLRGWSYFILASLLWFKKIEWICTHPACLSETNQWAVGCVGMFVLTPKEREVHYSTACSSANLTS